MPGRWACFKFVVTNSFGCTVFHVTKKISNTSYQLINMYLSHLSNIYVKKFINEKIQRKYCNSLEIYTPNENLWTSYIGLRFQRWHSSFYNCLS